MKPRKATCYCPTCGHKVNPIRLRAISGELAKLDSKDAGEWVPKKRGRKPRNPDSRDLEMANMYKNGKTLQEVGDAFGVSRERVRQLLKKYIGLSRMDGGQYIKSTPNIIDRAIRSAKRRDDRSWASHGCDYLTFKHLNKGMQSKEPSSPFGRFTSQRNNAKKRGISWEMTFFQWATIWNESGKWDKRGLGIGKYCMARKGDIGPYSSSNVYITTCDDNVRDYRKSLNDRGVIASDGIARLPEHEIFDCTNLGQISPGPYADRDQQGCKSPR